MRRAVLMISLLTACRSPADIPCDHTGRTRKVAELVEVAGSGSFHVYGYGLVSGLEGTGDSVPSEILPYAIEVFPPEFALALAGQSRLAFVQVQAELPAALKEGALIDVVVTPLKEADSLKGGKLHRTILRATTDSEVEFGVAEGSIEVGDEATYGTIAQGGRALVGYPSQIVQSGVITLSLNVSKRDVAERVSESINRALLARVARVKEGRIDLAVAEELLPIVLDVDVPMAGLYPDPIVWINRETRVVAWEGDVRVRAGMIRLICSRCHNSHAVEFDENESLESVMSGLGPDANFQFRSDLVQALSSMNALKAPLHSR